MAAKKPNPRRRGPVHAKAMSKTMQVDPAWLDSIPPESMPEAGPEEARAGQAAAKRRSPRRPPKMPTLPPDGKARRTKKALSTTIQVSDGWIDEDENNPDAEAAAPARILPPPLPGGKSR